ncbi:hypothetical protein DL98DRAFT_43885 [Cadophora sp. DSE1049]|nr:hypothetical protein DL98DRAFT_43885 [Cadophora sp. DSE1049]
MVTMKASALEERGMLTRDFSTQYPVGSSTLSLGAILGISVGGALLLFVILVTIGIIHVNKKHRREKQRSEANENGNATIDLKTAIRSTRPSENNMTRRVSFNPFLHFPEDDNREEWAKQDGLQKPPIAKSKSSHRSIFRTSSVRDSWPLNTTVPLGFRPGQTTIVLSPVAPPGYVVQDPKWPRRTTSLPGRKNSQDSSKSASSTRDPYSVDVMPYRKIHRRSTSETQLSTILRSTSQRLKAAQRQSMTLTSSTLGQSPGLPPSARLPTPPRMATESQEGLIDQEIVESVGSSIYDVYSRTPSPKKKHQRTSGKRSIVKPRSPAASIESKDSLCVSDTPDLVIPAPLTSPSKSPRVVQRQSASQASGAKDISVLIHQDSRESLFARGPQEDVNNKALSRPRHISLSDDPFYSSVRSSKPMMPSAQVQGPRPMYFRKATFGQEATAERPASFCSPLRNVSGNIQSSPKRDLPKLPATSEPNLFQWLPQEAMQARATQTSAKISNSRRKGHKRSNVIRMSNLSRPASIVDTLPEEPESVTPLKFNVPGSSSFHSVEKSQDASPTNSPKTSVRPPSIAIFNPTLIAPALSSRSEDNSPTLGSEDRSAYSPTLSVCNYYTENDPGSEDEFFKPRTSNSLRPSPSVIKSRRNGQSYSADLSLFPAHQSQQYLQERLMSFPPLPADVRDPVAPPISTPRPSPRPLPNITATMNSLRSSAASPAPPLLTVPGYLTGPRYEPEKQKGATLSPPGSNSIISSITLLRRMNSEVSTSCSSPIEIDSPTLRLDSPSTGVHDNDRDIDRTATIEERGRSRGSQHYLSFGQPSSSSRRRTCDKSRSARPEIRDSHRIHKERRRRRTEDLENGNMIDELTPVREGSSPAGGDVTDRGSTADTYLRFPTLSREGSVLVTPPRTKSRLSAFTLEPGVSKSAIDHANLSSSVNGTSTVLRSTEPPNGDIRLSPSRAESQLTDTTPAQAQAQAPHPPRWSDAIIKPTTHATRRESKLEHPVPSPGAVTPPNWTTGTGMRLSGLGLAGVRLSGGFWLGGWRRRGGRAGIQSGGL